MWIVCITSVRHVLTVNGYGGRQTKENEKSWCFKGWETLVNNNYSSFWLTKGDYLRLKNLEIGYTFRQREFLTKLGVQSIRLYLAGTNLLTFTSLDDYDPEKLSTDSRNDVHPNTRTYSFGVNVKF